MYYGKAEDMEVKASMTGNIAIEYSKKVIDGQTNIGQYSSLGIYSSTLFPTIPEVWVLDQLLHIKK